MSRLFHRIGSPGLLLIATGLGGVASAQDRTPQAAEDEIIVVGTRTSAEEERRKAVAFVRLTGVAIGQRPAARWKDPICPRTLGLASSYARIVDAKLRSIAAATGIEVAPESCRPNIVISFVSDGARLVRTISKRSPGRLAEVTPTDRKELLNGSAPIRWWYTTETKGKDGMSTSSDQPASISGGLLLPGNSDTKFNPTQGMSLIGTEAIRTLQGASVVVDMGDVEGLPLDTVANYAALVAFAEVRASASQSPHSLLGLFGANPNARRLTDSDSSFLRALYRLPLNRQARQHRAFLVRTMLSGKGEELGSDER